MNRNVNLNGRWLALALLLVSSACHAEHDDFDRFCHAHERAGLLDSDGPGDKAVKISRWLSENLKTRAARDVLEALPRLEPSQKRRALTDAASRHGVAPCPLADVTWPP